MSHRSSILSWIKHLALLLLVAAMPLRSMSAAETLKIEFFCPNVGGGTNEYFWAVWMTAANDDTKYIATLGYQEGKIGGNYSSQMKKFTPIATANDSNGTVYRPDGTDAKMGPTKDFLSTQKAGIALTIDLTRTLQVADLPNGSYKVHFETVRHNNNYSYATTIWNKTGSTTPRTAMTLSTTSSTPFKDVFFTYDVSGGPSNTMTLSAGNGQTGTVKTQLATAPAVIIKDPSNNPVSGVTVNFAVKTGGGTLSAASATTGASGIATVNWTLGAIAGVNNNTMTATASGVSGSPITFTASATAGAATKIAISTGNGQSAKVNTNVTTPPAVLVTDANNNPKAGVSVTFAVASGNGSITGTNPVITNASGIATIGSWKLGTKVGTNTLTASATGLTGSPVTFTATGTVAAADATKMALQLGNNQSATVSTAVPVAPAVLVTDAFDNVISGVSVTFTVASGGGSIVGGTATSDANGIAKVTSWTLGATAGPNTLTATKTGLTGSPVTFTATGVAASTNIITKQAGDGQTATVKTTVATKPSVKVTDSSNNPIAGETVTFTIASGGGTVTGGTATTDAAGIATIGSWTLGNKAGTNALNATANGKTVTFTATSTAAAASKIVIQTGNDQTATVGTAVAIKPQVLATDADDNPVNAVPVTFAVTAGGGSITGATPNTGTNGLATVGSWTLGSAEGANQLTATVSGVGTVTFNATAEAAPLPPDQVTVQLGNGQTATVGTAVAINPSVKVTDASDNPVAGVTVTFSVTLGGGTATGLTQTTDANGMATVGSWTLGSAAGANELTATVAGITPEIIVATAEVATTPTPTPPAAEEPKSCGYGSGLSALVLMLMASLSLMRITRRRPDHE
jgi:adhesin/invasin